MKKWTIGIILGTSLSLIAGAVAYRSHLLDTGLRTVQPYVEKHLERIIQAQEEQFGIDHDGVPDIKFRTSSDSVGGYYPFFDLLVINCGDAVTPDDLKESVFLRWKYADTVEDVLNHELAHWYCDQRGETLTGTYWPRYRDFPVTKDPIYPIQLTSEGIGTYFEFTSNPNLTKDWMPTNVPDDFKDWAL